MPYVDSAEPAAGQAAPSRRRAAAVRAGEAFAPLFAAVRESREQENARSRETGDSSRREKYLSDKLAEARDRKLDRQADRKPGRVEHLRENAAQDASRREIASPEREAHDARTPTREQSSSSNSLLNAAQLPQEASASQTAGPAGEAAGGDSPAAAPAPIEMTNSEPASIAGEGGAGAVAVQPSEVPPPAAPTAPRAVNTTQAETVATAGTGTGAAGAVQGACGSQQPDAGGAGAKETLPDGAQAISAKAGAAARSTSVQVDFQNLLNAADSRRAQMTGGRTDGAVSGRPAAGGGISLSEARALNELADMVRANLGGRHSSMTLRLDPPDLGQLRVDLRMHDQALTVRFEAETVAGQEALRSRLGDLKAALEQHGIHVSHVDVDLRQPVLPADTTDDAGPQYHQADREQDGSTQGQTADYGNGAPDSHAFSSSGKGGQIAADSGVLLGSEESPDVDVPAETGVDLIV